MIFCRLRHWQRRQKAENNESTGRYGRHRFYRITIAIWFMCFGGALPESSQFSWKCRQQPKNKMVSSPSSSGMPKCQHACVISCHTSVQCSVYWRTIKCCHRIKSITTANIEDAWNNTLLLLGLLPLPSQAMDFSHKSIIIMNSNKRKAIPVDVFMAIIASILAVGCLLRIVSAAAAVGRRLTPTILTIIIRIICYSSTSNKNENHHNSPYALKWNESDSIKLMCYGTSTSTIKTMRYDAVSKDLNLIVKEILIHFDSSIVLLRRFT